MSMSFCIIQAKPAKPDMQAYKKLKGEAVNITGHVAGVNVGDVFANRGELAILGLHRRIPQGIDGRCVTTGDRVSLSRCPSSPCAWLIKGFFPELSSFSR